MLSLNWILSSQSSLIVTWVALKDCSFAHCCADSWAILITNTATEIQAELSLARDKLVRI